jgi:hypothetical protein
MDVRYQAKQFARGFKKADLIQQRMIRDGVGYGQSVLDPRFKAEVAKKGISSKTTPAQFLGAYTSRTLIDVSNDGTRTYWWRYNHPLAIAQRGMELAGVNQAKLGGPSAAGAVSLGIALPAIATAGTYDITNPGQQFRPKGYAQAYAEEGAEDRRETSQPTQEIFERFFLGRTGKPLKYETAKQDIPDLTPERYGNYMQFLYQDKGLLNLGILKGTTENLQGKPEIRLLGFPATLPMAGGFVAGTASALATSTAMSTVKPGAAKAGKIALAGAAGSLAGIALGNMLNAAIATGNRPQLSSVSEYTENLG